MMSNEEFDKRVEFFLNQQAQFDADIQQIKEVQKVTGEKLERAIEGLAEAKEVATQTTANLTELANLTHEGFNLTIARFDVIAENSKNTDAKISALVDSQILTEEKLRKLIGEVDLLKKPDNGLGPA